MQKIPIRKIAAPDSPASDPKFSIRLLQQVVNGRKLVHALHRHDFFFILAVETGSGVHEIDFKPYQVNPDSVFILRPGQVHRLELSGDSKGFLMEFDPAFYSPKDPANLQRWKKASAKNFCKLKPEGFIQLNSFLTNILNEERAKKKAYMAAINANLDLFFIEYVRQGHDPKTHTVSKNAYSHERYDELVHLLENNIKSMKNVSQYASLLNLSSYQLNAITKSSVGKTVSDLINEQILLEAKRYLLATTSQVKDVADHLGYEDVSYFIRFFKKHTGHSPETFRKNFK